ncbi:MAG: hypothetical protein Q9163_006332 [Psora crenata]
MSNDSTNRGDSNSIEAHSYEAEHVHSVYESIAPHFSLTRHKPWPLVAQFLGSLAPGSVGLDVGCGNGKYLGINRDIYIVGSDRSRALVGIAGRQKGNRSSDVMVGDMLDLPHQWARFDFAISIAVIHHLSTRERRIQAIRSIMATLKRSVEAAAGGRALFYVWALEQKNSRRGWDEGHAQDVMVPWVMKQRAGSVVGADEKKTFERYYHLYRRGELEKDVHAAGGVVMESGYERDNWWTIASPQGQG